MGTATKPASEPTSSTTSAPSVEVTIARRAIAIDPAEALKGAKGELNQTVLDANRFNPHGSDHQLFRGFRERRTIAEARVDLVERIIAGGTADWPSVLAAADTRDAIRTIRDLATHSGTVASILELVARWTDADGSEIEALRADPEWHEAGGLFRRDGRKIGERLFTVSQRLPRRAAALAAASETFTRLVAIVVKAHRADIEVGLHEAGVFGGRAGAPPIAGIQRELDDATQQLAATGLASSIAPGPRTLELRARKAALQSQLDASVAAHAAGYEVSIRAQIDAAAAGDMAAWVRLCSSVAAASDSCPEGLADKLGAIGAESLSASNDPLFWRGVLESTIGRDPPGREAS